MFREILAKARKRNKYREREEGGQLGLFGAAVASNLDTKADSHERARDQHYNQSRGGARGDGLSGLRREHAAAADVHQKAADAHRRGSPHAAGLSRKAGDASARADAHPKSKASRAAAAAHRLEEAKRIAADRPPHGFRPAPGSKKGGWTDGNGHYWYPGHGIGKVGTRTAHTKERGKDAARSEHAHMQSKHETAAAEHDAEARDMHRSPENREKHREAAVAHVQAAMAHGQSSKTAGRGKVSAFRGSRADQLSEAVDDHEREEYKGKRAHHEAQAEHHGAQEGPEHAKAAEAHRWAAEQYRYAGRSGPDHKALVSEGATQATASAGGLNKEPEQPEQPEQAVPAKKTATVAEKLFSWYPNLRGKWGGKVEVVGDYGHPNARGEVVIRNEQGAEMAVKRELLKLDEGSAEAAQQAKKLTREAEEARGRVAAEEADYGRKMRGGGAVRYGAHDRPISSFSVPKGHTEIGDHPDFKHGTVTYPKALDKADAKRLGLKEIPGEAKTREVVQAAVDGMSSHASDHVEMSEDEPGYFKQVVGHYIEAHNVHMSRDDLAPKVEAALREIARQTGGG